MLPGDGRENGLHLGQNAQRANVFGDGPFQVRAGLVESPQGKKRLTVRVMQVGMAIVELQCRFESGDGGRMIAPFRGVRTGVELPVPCLDCFV